MLILIQFRQQHASKPGFAISDTDKHCETALLRVYNDIVTTIGRGNGAILVLLDLSAAFDTIDHDNLFCILENMSEFVVMH